MMQIVLLMLQLVTNPTYLDFDSPDHYAQAIYTYRIDFTQVGASQPFTGFDVAASAVTILDPAVVRVEINLTTQGQTALVALPFGTQYAATVIATSQGGSSPRSAPSNPFDRAPLTPRVVLNPTVGKR